MAKPANNIQQGIFKEVNKEPKTVAELAEALKVSAVYIRQQLALMMEAKLVEKADNRQPYIYKPCEIDLERINSVQNIKLALALPKGAPVDKDVPLSSFVSLFRKVDKDKWQVIYDHLELIGEALESLDEEGFFVETLED